MSPSKLNGYGSSAPTSFLASLTNGFRSGLISPAPSTTSITPITPMTPLTTPRTPAQALLGRYPYVNRKDVSNSNNNQRPPMPSQLPLNDHDREQQLAALHLFANFLNAAECAIEDISERENDGKRVVGPGIMRLCNDLADGIQQVAEELQREHQHIEKVMSDHDLRSIEEGSGVTERNELEATVATDETMMVLPSSHQEFLTSISAAHTILLDMAAALRSITQEEAQELGEVALEVASIFIWSLRMVYSNMMQIAHEKQDGSSQRSSGTKQVTWGNLNSSSNIVPLVEILGEEEKKDEHYYTESTTPRSGRYTPKLPTIPSSPTRYVSHNIPERVRVLWPPLFPALIEASKHCVYTAKEHPLAATAIGLSCGPAAIFVALITGPPLLVADLAIQSSYDALSHHTPIVENLEKGAASALQVTRLSVLCTKLVIKQSLSVGERQIKRRGGVEKICEDVVGGAIDMATHPLETAGMAWTGLSWMVGALRETVGCVVESLNVHVDIH